MANIHSLQRRLAALENFSTKKDLCFAAYETVDGLVPIRPGATLGHVVIVVPRPMTLDEWIAAVERGDYKTEINL